MRLSGWSGILALGVALTATGAAAQEGGRQQDRMRQQPGHAQQGGMQQQGRLQQGQAQGQARQPGVAQHVGIVYAGLQGAATSADLLGQLASSNQPLEELTAKVYVVNMQGDLNSAETQLSHLREAAGTGPQQRKVEDLQARIDRAQVLLATMEDQAGNRKALAGHAREVGQTLRGGLNELRQVAQAMNAGLNLPQAG